jgi:hypothetical protein
MLDLNPLFEFSRTHCIAICAALVPANLLATLQTMLFVGFRRPVAQVRLMAAVSSVYALIIIMHVWTWLAIGVVMIPTYVLTVLGCVCISINLGCVLLTMRFSNGLLESIQHTLDSWFQSILSRWQRSEMQISPVLELDRAQQVTRK